jgi:hypothetical protein
LTPEPVSSAHHHTGESNASPSSSGVPLILIHVTDVSQAQGARLPDFLGLTTKDTKSLLESLDPIDNCTKCQVSGRSALAEDSLS